jgi:L-rhamnose mutarotase
MEDAPMPRVGFLLHVKKDRLAEYRKAHENVWPEMLNALRKTGWKNYSLFLNPDGLLFGYVEIDDLQRGIAEMGKTEVNARWQKAMSGFFEVPPGKRPDQLMEQLELVFHLD